MYKVTLQCHELNLDVGGIFDTPDVQETIVSHLKAIPGVMEVKLARTYKLSNNVANIDYEASFEIQFKDKRRKAVFAVLGCYEYTPPARNTLVLSDLL